MNWKKATKQYRQVAMEAMKRLQTEKALRLEEERVVIAARVYAATVNAPVNPLVQLVTGQDVNVQEAEKILLESVENLEKFIQTYSQNTSQNVSEESLDNPPPV